MKNRLDEIIAHKRSEIEKLIPLTEKLRFAAAERNDFRSFINALRDPSLEVDPALSVIAEVKKASPSVGVITTDFDPVSIASEYARCGANAISVLTDEKFFQGKLSYLAKIREKVGLPLLRKDFIVHEAQIYEAVVAGADAILLIVAVLTQDELLRFLDIAQAYQLDVLVEVHNLDELDRALETDAVIIGVNNRNLKTFEVDIDTTRQLAEELGPDHILISESGISTGEEAQNVKQWGADAVLVGEALMRSDDKAAKMEELKAFAYEGEGSAPLQEDDDDVIDLLPG
ncbi:MAG: indole-3-glycerol phosphate synthase TrpC [Verrucomicrobiales bacterium]|nr:indole-3-glycerol phosphate synthase TrpC [Verrucomicrobiales bacterium]